MADAALNAEGIARVAETRAVVVDIARALSAVAPYMVGSSEGAVDSMVSALCVQRLRLDRAIAELGRCLP